jgi:thermostable 8-oxoguanine DNA glycosylase
MYENNIDIDKPKPDDWPSIEVERLFIFCIFDRVMPYEKVCEAYKRFDEWGLLSFDSISACDQEYLSAACAAAGLRFPNETAKFLLKNTKELGYTGDSIKEMTRDEMVKECPGIGYKLASMFCNRVHKTQYAIVDVHIDRFLVKHGSTAKTYLDKEKDFIKIAHDMGMTPDELDWKVWDENRIGNRNGNQGKEGSPEES